MTSKRNIRRKLQADFERARLQAKRSAVHIDAPAAGQSEREARDALVAHLLTVIGKLRDLATGVDDPALYVLVPDADDRAMFLAGARLAEFDGRTENAALCQRMAAETATIFPYARTELIQMLSQSWSSDTFELWVLPLPPSALPIAYDGTACGHGTLLLLPTGTVVRGGSA